MVAKALLLADVEGSVRLWEADRARAAAAFRRLDELVDRKANEHQAERPLEQGEGDSFVLAFADATRAVKAALDLQKTINAETELKVRMALHVGEVQIKPDGRYSGPAFNRAARLRALAHGGQVLLTRAAADQAAGNLPGNAGLNDLGEHRLRDLAKPERISQLTHPDLANDFPPIRSLTALPNNLPAQTTTFVGREDEIEQLTKLLERERLVTLTGAGGCGKTRLAIQVAAEISDDFRDGVWWVDLAPITDAALVAETVARAMGLRDDGTEDTADLLERTIKDKSLLVVLDNCEHLIEATANLAERLTPHTTILATSREPLGLAGEQAYRVPSLDTEQAVTLFADRATKTRPNFTLTDETKEQAEEICRRLDGIPLAIELAAARTRMFSPGQIVKALEDRFHVLTGGARTALPRQRTLEASVDWSYQLLTEDEQSLLNRLSVFAGTFDLEAAEQIGADDPDARYRILDLLGGLVDRSLVHVETDDRYRLLETIRVYARAKLDAAGEISRTRTRHLDHYVAVAERAEPHLEGPEAKTWIERLEADLDNLRAAMDWGLASGDPEKVLRLGGSIWALWWLRGAAAEIGRLLQTALEAEGTDTHARIKGLMAAEAINFYTGDMDVARRYGEEAVGLAEAAGDTPRVARAMVWYAWSTTWTDPGEAHVLFERGLALADQLASPLFRIYFRYGLGFQRLLTGSPAEGLALIEQAVEEDERLPAVAQTGHSVAWHGMSLWLVGRLEQADIQCRRGTEMNRARGDVMFVQNGLVGLIMSAIEQGDLERAHAHLDELSQFIGRSGFTLGERNIAFVTGILRALEGDIAGALDAAEGVIEDYRRFETQWPLGLALTFAGSFHLAAGSVDRAREMLEEARALGASLPIPSIEADALTGLARVALAAGSAESAEELAYEALAVAAPAWAMFAAVDALELIACASTRDMFAARLFGAASAARTSRRFRRYSYNDAAYEEGVARCRSSLGADAYEAAFAEGALMAADEAIAFALRGRGERGRPSAGWASLTPTELSVASLVAKGLTNPEIAAKLLCSRNTVKAHLAHVFTKLGLSTRSELAAEATRHGL